MFNIELTTSILELQNYLIEKNWISINEEILSLEKPGEGNMNVVLRVFTTLRSFILKQSRPFVQKYPSVSAPIDRIDTEYCFYKAINQMEPLDFAPEILGYDEHNYLLMMSDLGSCNDMSSIYTDKNIIGSEVDTLLGILKVIHNTVPTSDYPSNMALRQLNFQHLFVLPLMENNGFELDQVQPGLEALSLPYKKNKSLHKVITQLGKLYLSDGAVLLHGDYYPGSWMRSEGRLFVIDPEFSFLGFAEFDLGIMAGHLILATGQQDLPLQLSLKYGDGIDSVLVGKIAGMEIIRRLIGLAQLPLSHSLDKKEELLTIGMELCLNKKAK